MTFDPHFRMYREDPQYRRGGLASFAELAAELTEELADRRATYPDLVAKGRMTDEARKREIRVMGSLLWQHLHTTEPRPPEPPAVSWTEWIETLRREILQRRDRYPARIAAGRLDAATAWRKLELIENIHENLWLGCMLPEAEAARDAVEDRRKALEQKTPDRQAA